MQLLSVVIFQLGITLHRLYRTSRVQQVWERWSTTKPLPLSFCRFLPLALRFLYTSMRTRGPECWEIGR